MSRSITPFTIPVGRSDSQLSTFELRIVYPLENPVAVATAVQDPAWHGQISDTFVVTLTSVTPTRFTGNVLRVDQEHGWEQNVHVSLIVCHD